VRAGLLARAESWSQENSPSVMLTGYYAHAWGKSVIAAIYPGERSANYGYIEFVYQRRVAQRTAPSK